MAYSLQAAPPRANIGTWADNEPPRGLIEAFIVIQLLWGVFLFLPGAQPFRAYIRAMPYLSSLALFAFYYGSRKNYRAPLAAKFVVLAMLLMALNLFHPNTQLMAGIAQWVFQLSIVAPVFWAGKAVRSTRFLNKMLRFVFIISAVNALVGLLQIYFPQYLMPPEFSALGQSMNRDMVEMLSYEGAGGQRIIRPPGLSDMPGGAAVAGMLTGVMGLALSMRREWRPRTRVMCLAASAVGMVTLYLTQVRSLFMMMVVAVAALTVVVIRRGQRWEGIWVAFVGVCLITGSFLWALSLGGEALSNRFFSITESGLLESIQTNRGIFVEHTLNHLLYEYPFGAGLGRWGMMTVYFGDPHVVDSHPIWVEIQMTGWLLDGGVLMWVFYGGALAAALLYAYRQAVSAVDQEMVFAARLVFCCNLIVVGISFAAPVFNTQLGIQFWFLTAALYSAGAGLKRAARAREAATSAPGDFVRNF